MYEKECNRKAWAEAGIDMETECTCVDCLNNNECEFAWDLYNYNGDCLAEK